MWHSLLASILLTFLTVNISEVLTQFIRQTRVLTTTPADEVLVSNRKPFHRGSGRRQLFQELSVIVG
jgi:hypothetical protein